MRIKNLGFRIPTDSRGKISTGMSDEKGNPVLGEVKLIRTQRGVLVLGVFHTEVELECSRCLTDFRFPLKVNFEEEFLPVIDILSGLPVPPPDEPGTFMIDDHHIIDLDEAIRQYVLMAVPMKPLCREACAGMCPQCGYNLNQGACNCPPVIVDPRWAKLSQQN